jgi:hypothetical protein
MWKVKYHIVKGKKTTLDPLLGLLTIFEGRHVPVIGKTGEVGRHIHYVKRRSQAHSGGPYAFAVIAPPPAGNITETLGHQPRRTELDSSLAPTYIVKARTQSRRRICNRDNENAYLKQIVIRLA